MRMGKELVEIVRCKNCIHRPTGGKEDIHNIYPPKDSRGDEDYTCPCLCDDYWYSWYPSDEWFCAEGEAKGEADRKVLEQEPKTGHWIDDKCSECRKGTEDLISSPE